MYVFILFSGYGITGYISQIVVSWFMRYFFFLNWSSQSMKWITKHGKYQAYSTDIGSTAHLEYIWSGTIYDLILDCRFFFQSIYQHFFNIFRNDVVWHFLCNIYFVHDDINISIGSVFSTVWNVHTHIFHTFARALCPEYTYKNIN